jgi:hypothetical protein
VRRRRRDAVREETRQGRSRARRRPFNWPARSPTCHYLRIDIILASSIPPCASSTIPSSENRRRSLSQVHSPPLCGHVIVSVSKEYEQGEEEMHRLSARASLRLRTRLPSSTRTLLLTFEFVPSVRRISLRPPIARGAYYCRNIVSARVFGSGARPDAALAHPAPPSIITVLCFLRTGFEALQPYGIIQPATGRKG